MIPMVNAQGPQFTGLPDIPALNELKGRRQWVAWRYSERENGEITKPPVNPHNGYGASHSDPKTWGTYEQAAKWAVEHDLPGVGYVISDDDDFTGADLDDCRDNEFGGIETWAADIVNNAETYTEISPSGNGLRIIWRGKIDKTIKCDPMHVEVYKNKRYLTITGNHVSGTPLDIRPAPNTEAALRQRVESFKPVLPTRPTGVALSSVPFFDSPKKGTIALALGAGKTSFFRSVNELAMTDLGRWVPDLFGTMAVFQPGTRAWRVSSRDLGRDLEEDLSISPDGIVDFGVADMGDPRSGKRTPIDIALEFGRYRNAAEAARWLCGHLGVSPESLGWQKPKDHFDFNTAGPQPASEPGPQPISEESETADVKDETAKEPRFKFEKIGDLRKLPPAQWLVKDWIPDGGTGIFYGKWAAGKSFIGFDLALHLAYGMPDWHGAALPGHSQHVLVIAREGHQGFVNRVDAFKKHYGLVDDAEHITFMRGSVSFMREDDFNALVAAVKADATLYRLVIVDTVARVLPGVDLNEQMNVTAFMERISILGEVTKASTIGVHHENKNGGMMGSIYFEANADFVFEISRDGEEDGPLKSGEITCTKMKDGEDRWKRAVQYTKISLSLAPDGPGSLVVQQIGTPPPPAKATSGWPDRETCRRILNAVNEAWISGKPWSHSPQSPDRFAPKMMAQRFDISIKIARDMLEKWLLNDLISIEIRDAHTKQKGLKVIGQIE